MKAQIKFKTTKIFNKQVTEMLSAEQYDELKDELAINPARGDIMKGSGGARKIRVAAQGRGKSGGARVIYYLPVEKGVIYLLLIYLKSKKETLTDKERLVLCDLVKELKNG